MLPNAAHPRVRLTHSSIFSPLLFPHFPQLFFRWFFVERSFYRLLFYFFFTEMSEYLTAVVCLLELQPVVIDHTTVHKL